MPLYWQNFMESGFHGEEEWMDGSVGQRLVVIDFDWFVGLLHDLSNRQTEYPQKKKTWICTKWIDFLGFTPWFHCQR